MIVSNVARLPPNESRDKDDSESEAKGKGRKTAKTKGRKTTGLDPDEYDDDSSVSDSTSCPSVSTSQSDGEDDAESEAAETETEADDGDTVKSDECLGLMDSESTLLLHGRGERTSGILFVNAQVITNNKATKTTPKKRSHAAMAEIVAGKEDTKSNNCYAIIQQLGHSQAPAMPAQNGWVCPLCGKLDVPKTCRVRLQCGHEYCQHCWTDLLQCIHEIAGGKTAALVVTCPNQQCCQIVTQKSLLSPNFVHPGPCLLSRGNATGGKQVEKSSKGDK